MLISVCIPAYKRTSYLKRLLESLASQTFKDIEIVITDDSPNNEVELLCGEYAQRLPIVYYKNPVALGTPENWNEAIRKAKGEWIKIMHDDDWFTSSDSLQQLTQYINANPNISFFFSAYQNVYEQQNNKEKVYRVSEWNLHKLHKSPLHLFKAVFVGNPSCTLYKKNGVEYDKRFKWVVDFEFYIRYLRSVNNEFVYINKPLINVGMNDTQVTTYTFRVSDVEIPESHLALSGFGFESLKNIAVYDSFWRLYRNLKIRSIGQIRENGYEGVLPKALSSMIRWQSLFPYKLLRFGPFSKCLMFLHYMIYSRSVK